MNFFKTGSGEVGNGYQVFLLTNYELRITNYELQRFAA
jgi:hypothetical protein